MIRYMTSSGDTERGTMNPIIQMKNLGDYTLGAAETAFGTWVTLKATVAVTKGNIFGAAGNFMTGIGDGANAVLDAVGPMVFMLLIPLIVVGAGLSIYLPLIPFITWFGAIINWLIVVGEAIVAAPLWAITHLGGEGDGMGHKSAHGYIFLLNVMVRPFLMVIGFFFGGACLIAGGTALNELFGIAIANVQFDSLTGLVSMIFFMGIYFMLCVNLIHSCFSLIFIVPDQVINWVGGTAAAAPGRESAGEVKNSLNVFSGKLERLMPGGSKSPKPSGTSTDPSNGLRK